MSEQNFEGSEVVRSGRTLEQVKTGYTTAVRVQIPRVLKEVNRRLKDEALMGGESFYYGWGSGKDKIEGPSIHLAMSAARCWGNCAVDLDDVQDLGDCWIFTAVFIDVETGFTLKRQFRQSKTSIIYGKHDEERKADMRFQIGQSKAVRNVVVNAIPKHLVREAIETAKRGVREKIERRIEALNQEGKNGMAIAQDTAVAALKKSGVTEEAVLLKLGRPTVKAITVDDLIIILGDIAAINDGSDRADELFPGPQGDDENATSGVMDHLGDDDGDSPEVKAQTNESPEDEKTPTPKGKKGGKKPPKPKSEAVKEKTPTDTPPEEKIEENKGFVPPASADEVTTWAGGSLGDRVVEAIQEIRSRYNRLADDLDSLDKAAIDWENLGAAAGAGGVLAVQRVLAHFQERAEKEGMGKDGGK